MREPHSVDFGYRKVAATEKTYLVGEVFSSVADSYDLMNDLMSLGIHRLWKWFTIYQLAPRRGDQVIDVAGGTGDLALKIYPRIAPDGRVVLADINSQMLERGRDRLLDRGIISGIEYVQADAEYLPFAKNTFDLATVSFGLRNITDKQQALTSIRETLKYGGRILILEFSHVVIPILAKIYEEYSFKIIPWIGKKIANDEASYRYLVESIRTHPDQKTLAAMLTQVGFENVHYQNFCGGIVALHSGYKL